MTTSSISSIRLHYADNADRSFMAHERERAAEELHDHGHLSFMSDAPAPYALELSIYNRQLVIHGKDADGADLPQTILSLSPYRGIIRDYFMMIEAYEKARSDGNQAKLEPIDMARRGLHNEAADLLVDRLRDKILMDHATARRLFTLICALHMDQARLWQQ